MREKINKISIWGIFLGFLFFSTVARAAGLITDFEVKEPMKRGETQFLMATFKIPAVSINQAISFEIKFDWLGHYAPVEIGLLNKAGQKSISLRFWHYERPPECYLLVYRYRGDKLVETEECYNPFSPFDNKTFRCRINLLENIVFATVERGDKVLWQSEELGWKPEIYENGFIEVVDIWHEIKQRRGKIRYDKETEEIIFHSEGGNEPANAFHMDGKIGNFQILETKRKD